MAPKSMVFSAQTELHNKPRHLEYLRKTYNTLEAVPVPYTKALIAKSVLGKFRSKNVLLLAILK